MLHEGIAAPNDHCNETAFVSAISVVVPSLLCPSALLYRSHTSTLTRWTRSHFSPWWCSTTCDCSHSQIWTKCASWHKKSKRSPAVSPCDTKLARHSWQSLFLSARVWSRSTVSCSRAHRMLSIKQSLRPYVCVSWTTCGGVNVDSRAFVSVSERWANNSVSMKLAEILRYGCEQMKSRSQMATSWCTKEIWRHEQMHVLTQVHTPSCAYV